MALDLCYNIVSRRYLEHLQTNLLQTVLRSSYLGDVVWYCRLMSSSIMCICTKLNLRGGVSCMPAALLFFILFTKAHIQRITLIPLLFNGHCQDLCQEQQDDI